MPFSARCAFTRAATREKTLPPLACTTLVIAADLEVLVGNNCKTFTSTSRSPGDILFRVFTASSAAAREVPISALEVPIVAGEVAGEVGTSLGTSPLLILALSFD